MQIPIMVVWGIAKDIIGWIIRRKKKRCLLVVEDNRDDAELTEAKIQRLGWDCDVVSSAEAAWPLLLTKRHSVVLLDIGLPYESGGHLAGRILKNVPDTHVVIVTGEGSYVSELMRGAYFGLVLKPLTPDALRDIFNKPKHE